MADEAIKTLAVKLALEDSTFQAGMKELKSELSVADAAFKASGAGIKNWGSTLDGMKAHAQELTSKIQTQNEIISLNKDQLSKVQAALNSHVEAMQKDKQAVSEAREAYEKNVSELGKNAEETKKSKQALDDVTDAYKRDEQQVLSNQKAVNTYTAKVDNATAALKNMQKELKDNTGYSALSKQLTNTGEKISETGDKVLSTGNNLTVGVTAPLVAAGTAAYKFFSDYQNGMAKISTIADTSKISLDTLGQGIIKISNDTNTSLSTMQEAEYQAISSGVDTADSLNFMTESAKAAKGGFTDVDTAVDGSTTVLNAYGLSADHAKDIFNQMIVAQNLGKTTLGQMAQSIGLVADTTANCNIKTQDLFSSLAVETSHGIDTSEAVSGLREALSNIIKPTDDAQKEAQQLGLQFNAAHLKSVGWAQFLSEIAQKTGGNTEAMGKLFGSVQGLNTMVTLTSQSGMSLFNQSLQDMNSNTDYVDDAFNKVSDTSGQKLTKSINELKNSAIEFGDKISPLISDASDLLGNLGDVLSDLSPQAQDNIVKFAGLLAVIGPLTSGVGGLTKGIGLGEKGIGAYIGIIGKVCDKFGLFQKATKAATAATEAETAAEGVAAAATAAEGTAAAGATVATAAFDATLLPVIGIAVAVAAAIAGITFACIKINDYMSKSSIPTVQLFGSETDAATKKAVTAYENLNTKATEQLMSLETGSKTLSQKTASELVSTFETMGQQIEQGFDTHFSKDYQTLSTFFATSNTLTSTEETKILASMSTNNAQKKAKIQDYENQITGIINTAASQHRGLTQEEYQKIAGIQKQMQSEAITALSTTESQANAIRDRMKNSAAAKTAQEAADVVKNAKNAKDNTIKAANEQYAGVVNSAQYEHDVLGTLTDSQYDEVVTSAKKTRTDTVNQANHTFDETVAAAKKKTPEFVGQIDWQNGTVRSRWQQLNFDAITWGTDFVANLILGMGKKASELYKTVSGMASSVASIWKHSVPKEGPLKDDDIWTIHMMENFENGIKVGTPSLIAQAVNTATAIKNAFAIPDVSNISNRIQSALNNSTGLTVNAQLSGASGGTTTIDKSKNPEIHIHGNVYVQDKGSRDSTLQQIQFLAQT